MKKILKVWIKKQGYPIDEDTTFNIKPNIKSTIKNIDGHYKTIEFRLERNISLEEYQGGFIGKYCRELKDSLAHFLQEYVLRHGLEIVIDPKEVYSNEEELYKEFSLYCDEHKLKDLPKPSGGSAYFVFEDLESRKVDDLSKRGLTTNPDTSAAIDWYNTGKLQQHSTNTFLHFFIPLELLSQRFVNKTSWKKENEAKYMEITNFLRSKLAGEGFKHKLASLESSLPRFAFMEQIEKYFSDLFTTDEIDHFWEDDTDVTFNGKHQWNIYRQMSHQERTKERVNLFRVMKRLYDIRNNIVHNGLRDVASEDIFLIENILRRVLKKELTL